MDQLKIIEKIGSNYVLLEVSGVINSYTSTEFQQKVFSYVLDTNLVIDVENIEEIDSTGVGIIMAGFNDAEDSDHKLYMMNPSSAVRKAFEDTGFFDTFHFIHSVTEVV